MIDPEEVPQTCRALDELQLPLPKLPTCAIEASIVRPQLERLNRDVNAAHSQLRDHGTIIEKLLIWRDESSRRIGLLEQSASERNQVVGELKLELEAMAVRVDVEFQAVRDGLQGLAGRVDGEFQHLRGRVNHVNNGIETLLIRFDRHADEMKEAAVDATKAHEKSMRSKLTISYTIGALAAVLIMLHGAITGNPIIDYLRATYKVLLP